MLANKMKFKLEHHRQECIGCGACESVCPEFWKLADDMKADLKGSKIKKDGEEIVLETLGVAELDDIMEAAEVCPVNCIHVYEDGEKKV